MSGCVSTIKAYLISIWAQVNGRKLILKSLLSLGPILATGFWLGPKQLDKPSNSHQNNAFLFHCYDTSNRACASAISRANVAPRAGVSPGKDPAIATSILVSIKFHLFQKPLS